jgi:hypothetical protein
MLLSGFIRAKLHIINCSGSFLIIIYLCDAWSPISGVVGKNVRNLLATENLMLWVFVKFQYSTWFSSNFVHLLQATVCIASVSQE